MATIRVLIVDDCLQVRQELATLLPLAGDIQIAGEASNGLQAIQQVQALHPDAVLMDLEMPVIDGYEATRRIKAAYPSCRIVALSVHGYQAARDKARQAGVDAFVIKGASVAVIVSELGKGSHGKE